MKKKDIVILPSPNKCDDLQYIMHYCTSRAFTPAVYCVQYLFGNNKI